MTAAATEVGAGRAAGAATARGAGAAAGAAKTEPTRTLSGGSKNPALGDYSEGHYGRGALRLAAADASGENPAVRRRLRRHS